MKTRIYLSLTALLLSAISSCSKEEKNYSRQELQHTADSILTIEIKHLRRQAKEDLDRRLPIELKPKVDSILNISYKVPVPPQIGGEAHGAEDTASMQAPEAK